MSAATVGACIGIAADRAGWVKRVGGELEYGALDPDDAALTQPRAPVLFRHDADLVLGHVEWWEKGNLPGLVAVATLTRADLLDPDRDWFFSPGMTSVSRCDGSQVGAVIHELSVTPTPAGRRLPPVAIARGCTLADGAGAPYGLSAGLHSVWRHALAAASTPTYRRSAALTIFDAELDELRTRASATPAPVVHARSDDGLGRRYRHSLGGRVISWD